MGKVATPIDTILDDVEKGLHAGLWYTALVVALTIPEICAALEQPDGTGGSSRYKAWYNRWLGPKYQNLTADDCYSLRCGVLHQGRMGRPDMQYSRVLFTVPNKQRNVFHNNILNDALNLDLSIFCHDVMDAARMWYSSSLSDESVAQNSEKLVRFRAQGLAPYMVGMPLIT